MYNRGQRALFSIGEVWNLSLSLRRSSIDLWSPCWTRLPSSTLVWLLAVQGPDLIVIGEEE